MKSVTSFEKRQDLETMPIWRYMDFTRFVSMLSTGGLWFSKAAMFGDDPWEGFGKTKRFELPSAAVTPKVIQHESGAGTQRKISLGEMMADLSQRAAEIFENARDHLYVNSWCLESESMGMWLIYGSQGCGLAIQSSVEQYQRAARFNVDSSHYEFGPVNYHDELEAVPDIQLDLRYSIPLPGAGLRREVLKLGLHKRSCFSYEHEWRAVLYQDHRPEIAGVHESFDLDELISAVFCRTSRAGVCLRGGVLHNGQVRSSKTGLAVETVESSPAGKNLLMALPGRLANVTANNPETRPFQSRLLLYRRARKGIIFRYVERHCRLR